MSEDVIVRVEGKSDASDGEPPAYLDETEEGLGAEQTAIPVQADALTAQTQSRDERATRVRPLVHLSATNMRQWPHTLEASVLALPHYDNM